MLPFAHTLVSDSVSSFLRELFGMYSAKHNLRSAIKLVIAKGSTSLLFFNVCAGLLRMRAIEIKCYFLASLS